MHVQFAGSANGTSRTSGSLRMPPGQRRLSGSHPESSLEVGDDSMVDEAVTEGAEIVTDLCVIGAGPTGITIARELDNNGLTSACSRPVDATSDAVSSGRAEVRATATRFIGWTAPGFEPSVAR